MDAGDMLWRSATSTQDAATCHGKLQMTAFIDINLEALRKLICHGIWQPSPTDTRVHLPPLVAVLQLATRLGVL
jgi:hypothetical protein